MDEHADEMRHDIQEHLSAVILEQIVKGEVGAVATPDENANGCCLMKFRNKPFHCEERSTFWCTESKVEVTHLVHHVVLGLVLMEDFFKGQSVATGMQQTGSHKIESQKDHKT